MHDKAGDLTHFFRGRKKHTVAVPCRNHTGFPNNFLLQPRASLSVRLPGALMIEKACEDVKEIAVVASAFLTTDRARPKGGCLFW